MASKLYVGGLSYSTTSETLREYFAQCGTVESASVITDKFSGQSRGFGFVEMSNAEEAQRAIADLNGKDLDGRKLTVNLSNPRPAGGCRRRRAGPAGRASRAAAAAAATAPSTACRRPRSRSAGSARSAVSPIGSGRGGESTAPLPFQGEAQPGRARRRREGGRTRAGRAAGTRTSEALTRGGDMTGAAVAINASVVGRNPTGLGLYAINLVQRLDRMRQDFELFTSSPGAFAPIRAPVRRLWPLVRPEHGLGGHAARLAWTQVALRLRAREARVLLNTVPEGPIGGAPDQVTVVHDLLPLFFPEEYPRQQHYFRYLVPRVLRCSRVVVADSESTRQEVMRRYALPAAQVRVVYPGFDPERFHWGRRSPPASGIPYLLYVGNLLPHKNLLRLVEAFAAVRRWSPCRLVIRGAGRPPTRGPSRRGSRPSACPMRLTSCRTPAAMPSAQLYARAACLVYPSLAEGFGLPILEAMASGTPVVTSNVSSLPEVAGGAALVVDPYDAAALAEAIGLVLTRPALRAELRERGLARARQFSWDQTAAEISRLIDLALTGDGAAPP